MKRAKRLLAVILSVVMLSSVCVYSTTAEEGSQADITSNLSGHWDFESVDENENPVNTGTNTELTAVLQGDTVSVADSGDSAYGKVLRFTPQGSQNSRMFIENWFNPNQGDFSVAMWVYNAAEQSTSKNSVLLQFTDKNGATGRTMLYRGVADKYTVYMNGTDVIVSDATADGKWEHLVVTKENLDNGNYMLKFYIDGTEVYSGENNGANVINTVTDLVIGAHKNRTDTGTSQFVGDIDDLRFYERVLTAEDVSALYGLLASSGTDSQLQSEIDKAQELIDSGKLPTDHQAVVSLANAIEKAKNALASGTEEEKQSAVADLQEKENAYNTAAQGGSTADEGLVGYWSADSGSLENQAPQGTLTASITGSNVTVEASDITEMGNMLAFQQKTSGNSSNVTVAKGLNSQNDFTISMWIKNSESQKNLTQNIAILQQTGDTGRTILFRTNSGQYGTYISEENKYFGSATPYEEWQHLALVKKGDGTGSGYTIALYVDGVKLGEHQLSKNNAATVTDLLFGSHKQLGNNDQFAGSMDELRIYTRALEEDEITYLYQEFAAPVNEQKLVALMADFEELLAEAKEQIASGAVAEDSEEALALKAAIEKGEAIPDDILYEDMLEEYAALELAIDNYLSAAPVTITINTDDVTNIIDNGVFGINHRFGFNAYGTFDSETMTMKQEFVDLYEEAGFGSVRYPGGSISNLFQWKGTLGDKDERLDQVHGYYNTVSNGQPQRGIASNFGIKEIGDFAYDMGSEIVYVYGMGRGSAMDAADLVEYLNAPNDGSNPNGGIDWAAVRAENGHPEPYNVRYFEMGNEMNQGGDKSGDGTICQRFWTNYVDGKAADLAYVEGGTVVCEKQYAVKYDDWNAIESYSDGTAGQVFYMRYANPHPALGIANGDIGLRELTDENSGVMEQYNYDPADYADFKAISSDAETTKVYVDDEEWAIVEDLSAAGANDKVVEIDYATGAIIFGDGVNGAIPAANSRVYVSYTVEREGFIEISQAMRDTMDQINANLAAKGEEEKELYIYTSWESTSFINYMQQAGVDDLYDGMTIHPYAGTPSGGSSNEETREQFYYSSLSLIPGTVSRVRNLVEEMRNITGDDSKVPVISEYGIYPSYDTMVRSQTHALYIARVLMEYIRLGSPYIQKHCLVDWYSSGGDSLGPTQQAVIQAVPQAGADIITGEGEYKFFSTPSARVFQMFNSAYGEEVLSSTFDVNRALENGTEQYAAMASKDAEGNIYLAVVNSKLTGNGTIDIKVDGADLSGKTLEIQYISGDTFYAENTLENPDNVAVISSTATVDADSETARVVLEPHSFTIIKVVDALGTQGGEGEAVDTTELQSAVDEAIKMAESGKYTAESVEALEQAIAAAKKIIEEAALGTSDITEDDVAQAIADIETCIGNLVEVSQPDVILGDVNGDGIMDIDDATYLQKALAKLVEITDDMRIAGDVNKDGRLSIIDVTLIQLALANNEEIV